MNLRFWRSLFAAGVCAGALHAPALAAGPRDGVPLIPREALFGNPDRASPQLSPDGTKISWLAPVDGVMNVWVAPVGDLKAARPVTSDTGRGIRIYLWTYANDHVLYLQDKGGDENWRAYAVNVDTLESRDLTPYENVAARISGASDKFPDEVLISVNDRDPRYHDLYRVNFRTGERTLVQQNDGFLGFLTDHEFEVRKAMRMRPDGGMDVLKPAEDGGWEPDESVPAEDLQTTSVVGYDRSGSILYRVDSRGRDTAALFAEDVASGKKALLAENGRADADDVIVHPYTRAVQAVAFYHTRKEWTILDKDIRRDFEYLRTVADGDIELGNRTLDDTQWIVAYLMDDGPVRYYRYDRGAGKAHFLFTNRAALEGLPLAKMHPVVIESRDGLDLVSYLTLPVWADSDRDGRPAEPVPMVLLVHGGPWGRDTWGLDGMHQWLANRGYAVLSVNFRGSTGFGKGFINAANMEWAGKMHDDLLDAVEWAVAEKIADKDKVAIMGGSYGGYATLVGLTFTPDVFACGVDIVGPSNIVTLLNTIPAYWTPMIEMFASRVGDHRTEEGRAFLESRSPLSRVDQIRKPLLIGQGANDPRVKQSESDQIVRAMREKNIPVTYVLYPDEGHGFARPENRTSFFAVTEAFLSQHLGGAYEPIGKDFKGSSITVPAGAEQVPGLEGALKNATP